MTGRVLANVTGVSVGGQVLLIEGPPGSGKSSLALSLIDRGAVLIGDDAVRVTPEGAALIASPPPNTSGMMEIRNVGIVEMPVSRGPVSLVLTLDTEAPRFPLEVSMHEIEGLEIPVLAFAPGDAIQALRAEHALTSHGLPLPKPGEWA